MNNKIYQKYILEEDILNLVRPGEAGNEVEKVKVIKKKAKLKK